MTRVLVCGGRNFGVAPRYGSPDDEAHASAERASLRLTLDALHRDYVFDAVIHGGAHGADMLAGEWAAISGVEAACFPAEWSKYGHRAGPLRNERMLAEGQPDLVVAFPGSKGTAHMVRIAREAGVEVIEVGP